MSRSLVAIVTLLQAWSGKCSPIFFATILPAMKERREEMMAFSLCFGQGLQLTNILKDIWEDQQDGSCWLPRSVFDRDGAVLKDLMQDKTIREFYERDYLSGWHSERQPGHSI